MLLVESQWGLTGGWRGSEVIREKYLFSKYWHRLNSWCVFCDIFYTFANLVWFFSMKKLSLGALFLFVLLFVIPSVYRYTQKPSNERDWVDRDALLATSSIVWDQITIFDVRNFTRRSDDDFDRDFYDTSFSLQEIESVDFFSSTFAFKEKIGHTFLSFGLVDWSQIVISIEARKEKWEEYSPVKWIFNQYELAYVIADEKDIISLRTEVRGDPVYQYELDVSADNAQKLFLSLIEKSNDLSITPAFYNTLVDNCTSVLWKHVNKISPWRLGVHIWLLLTWLSDYYLFDQWLINTTSTRESLRVDHRINEKVGNIVNSDDFSILLRE